MEEKEYTVSENNKTEKNEGSNTEPTLLLSICEKTVGTRGGNRSVETALYSHDKETEYRLYVFSKKETSTEEKTDLYILKKEQADRILDYIQKKKLISYQNKHKGSPLRGKDYIICFRYENEIISLNTATSSDIVKIYAEIKEIMHSCMTDENRYYPANSQHL